MALEILVAGNGLADRLQLLDRYIGDSSEFVYLRFDGKNQLWLSKQSTKAENVRAAVCIEAHGKKAGKIAVNSNILASLCRKRKNVVLSLDKLHLAVSDSKRYQANTLTVDPDDHKVTVLPKKVTGTELSKKAHKILTEALGIVALKAHFNTEVLSGVSVWSGSEIDIICNDPYHGAWYHANGIGTKLNFTLPVNYALLLSSLLKESKEKSHVSVDKTNLYFWNEGLQLAWPLMEPRVKLKDFAKSFKVPKSLGTLKREDLEPILLNLNELYEANSYIGVETSSKTIKLRVRSTRGSAAEAINYRGKLGKIKTQAHPGILNDLVRRLPNKFNIGFNDRSLYLGASLKYGGIQFLTMSLETGK